MGRMDAKPMPDCLPAKLYLLAWDAGRRRVRGGEVLSYVLRAGILAELHQRGCLTDRDGRAVVADRRTGDPMLDWVLRDLAARPRPKRWKALVQRDRRRSRQAVERQLEATGAIRVERRTLLPDRVLVERPEVVRQLRAEASGPLFDHAVPVPQIPRQQAALTVMAAVGRLPDVFTGRDRWRNRGRLKELTAYSGVVPRALKKALTERAAGNTPA